LKQNYCQLLRFGFCRKCVERVLYLQQHLTTSIDPTVNATEGELKTVHESTRFEHRCSTASEKAPLLDRIRK